MSGTDWRALAHAEQLLELRRDVEAELCFLDVLVDDNDLVRESLRDMLADEPDIEVVGEAADGREPGCAARRPASLCLGGSRHAASRARRRPDARSPSR